MEYIILNNNKENIENLSKYLKKNDESFPVKLSEKIDFLEYSKKIITKGIAIIATTNNKWIGCLTGYVNDRESYKAYISVLVVEKEFRSKLIGKKLLNSFIKTAYENEMKEIFLYVHKDNYRAIKFYEREGFLINKEKANYDYSIIMKKKISKKFNILITSVGRRGYLVKYFKESLNGIGKVHVANSSDITPAFQYADYSVVTPLIYNDKYIHFIIDYCKKNNIDAVISLFDIDLPILAKNKKKFEDNNIKLIVSNYEFVQICNDKWKSYDFLKQLNFNVPKTYIDINTLKKDISNGELDYPIIIKPRWGMGSISVLQADNEEELNVFYKKVKRNIFKSYLKYESNFDIEHCIIFQEKLIGQEYGLDIINDLNCNYVTTIIKEKLAMRSGETDCAKVVENEKIEIIGKLISQNSKHIANLDVDMFLVDNIPYVLEMNARFGGGYPFSQIAGVNLPKAIIEWCMSEKVDKECFKPEIGVLAHKDIKIVKI